MSKPDKPKVVGVRIDIETRSREDLKKTGVYRYVESPDFRVLLISYSLLRLGDDGKVRPTQPRLLDLTNAKAVQQFQRMLLDKRFQKHAYNANFERIALSRWMGLPTGEYIDPKNWHCTAVRANVNGVFGSLDEVARALRSPVKKDPEGRRLIGLFSKPDTESGLFHETAGECWCGQDHGKDFAKFGAYCDNDVMTEAVVSRSLHDVPERVQRQYEMDQRINDRGVKHRKKLSEQAVAQVEAEKVNVMAALRAITGVDNPNSGQQMMGWLESQGYPMPSLDKAHREEALEDPYIPPHVAKVLELKGLASLSSVAKHKAALNTRCADGRIRGSLQFYGAHTGREAGRGIQPQNLPRYEAPDEDRKLLLKGKAGSRAPEIAKGSVRASLVPRKGHVFVVPDYNAIEARCLGWLAGEQWVEDEFRIGEGKIYEATAATMFGVIKEHLINDLKKCGKCGKDSCIACQLRNKGKISNLALGYGGGAGALVVMGAESAGIDIGNFKEVQALWRQAGSPGKFHEWNPELHDYPELIRLRDLYRDASPETVRFWKLCAKAWDVSATTGNGARFGQNGVVSMVRDGRHNRLVLPSGRSLWYRHARSVPDKDNPDRIDRRIYTGKGTGVGHSRTDTHGGKLTENITQAVARDVLFDLMLKLEKMSNKGWPGRLVLHVHDEVVLEVPEKHADRVLADTLALMGKAPKWAPGLALRGEGKTMDRYGK